MSDIAILTPEAVARIRGRKSVAIVISDTLGMGSTLLHRFGVVNAPPAADGLVVTEVDPHRFLRGVRQQPLIEKDYDTAKREHAAWQDLVEELTRLGVSLNEENDLASALRKWGEELHSLRDEQKPEVAANKLVECREAYPGRWERDAYGG